MPTLCDWHVPLGLLGRGEVSNGRSTEHDPSSRICFSSSARWKCAVLLSTLWGRSGLRGHLSFCLFLHKLYGKVKADASGNSGALEWKCISPEGKKWKKKTPLKIVNIVCADVLLFNLKTLCVWGCPGHLPTRGPALTQIHRIKGFFLLSFLVFRV